MTKNETKRQYGIAILMMLFLHLFRSSVDTENYSILNNIFQTNVLAILTDFCGICVACYAFITGYGFSEQTKGVFENEPINVQTTCKHIVTHIVKLYKKYWLVFCVFVPLGYLNGSYQDVSIKKIVLSLIGLDNSLCGAWWYVWQYVILCVVLPLQLIVFDLLSKVIKRETITGIKKVIFSIVLWGSVTFALWAIDGFKVQKVIYGIICILGYLSSKYEILNKGRQRINRTKYSGLLCGLLLILLATIRIYHRIVFGGANGKIDIILIIPYYIITCVLVEKCTFTWKTLELFGKYSTYMWLIHDLFLVTKLESVICLTNIAVLKYMSLIIVSFICGYVMMIIEKKIYGIKKANNRKV